MAAGPPPSASARRGIPRLAAERCFTDSPAFGVSTYFGGFLLTRRRILPRGVATVP